MNNLQRLDIRDVPSHIVDQFKVMAILQHRSVHLIIVEALVEYVQRHNSEPSSDAANIDNFNDRRADALIGRR